ncbi:hypothetical protein MFKK_17490 [Halopseudomonas aestusnigri]|nr:hypothetical protein MFKK_17490 [Halopseudomonas aestusnigri]
MDMKKAAGSGKRQAASGKRNQGECRDWVVRRFLKFFSPSPLDNRNPALRDREGFA